MCLPPWRAKGRNGFLRVPKGLGKGCLAAAVPLPRWGCIHSKGRRSHPFPTPVPDPESRNRCWSWAVFHQLIDIVQAAAEFPSAVFRDLGGA